MSTYLIYFILLLQSRNHRLGPLLTDNFFIPMIIKIFSDFERRRKQIDLNKEGSQIDSLVHLNTSSFPLMFPGILLL